MAEMVNIRTSFRKLYLKYKGSFFSEHCVDKLTFIYFSFINYYCYFSYELLMQAVYVCFLTIRADVKQNLRCLSAAADKIAIGDTIDAVIRRGQKWNMLPTQVS